jgi:hypothetical protein
VVGPGGAVVGVVVGGGGGWGGRGFSGILIIGKFMRNFEVDSVFKAIA